MSESDQKTKKKTIQYYFLLLLFRHLLLLFVFRFIWFICCCSVVWLFIASIAQKSSNHCYSTLLMALPFTLLTDIFFCIFNIQTCRDQSPICLLFTHTKRLSDVYVVLSTVRRWRSRCLNQLTYKSERQMLHYVTQSKVEMFVAFFVHFRCISFGF